MAINIKKMTIYFAGSRFFESEVNARENSDHKDHPYEVISQERTVVDCDGVLYLLGDGIVSAHDRKDPNKLARNKALAKLTYEDLAVLGLIKG